VGFGLNSLSALSVARFPLEKHGLFYTLVVSLNLNRWQDVFLLTGRMPYQRVRKRSYQKLSVQKRQFLFAAWKFQTVIVQVCFAYKIIFSPNLTCPFSAVSVLVSIFHTLETAVQVAKVEEIFFFQIRFSFIIFSIV
jgi:hypothetical protein